MLFSFFPASSGGFPFFRCFFSFNAHFRWRLTPPQKLGEIASMCFLYSARNAFFPIDPQRSQEFSLPGAGNLRFLPPFVISDTGFCFPSGRAPGPSGGIR